MVNKFFDKRSAASSISGGAVKSQIMPIPAIIRRITQTNYEKT